MIILGFYVFLTLGLLFFQLIVIFTTEFVVLYNFLFTQTFPSTSIWLPSVTFFACSLLLSSLSNSIFMIFLAFFGFFCFSISFSSLLSLPMSSQLCNSSLEFMMRILLKAYPLLRLFVFWAFFFVHFCTEFLCVIFGISSFCLLMLVMYTDFVREVSWVASINLIFHLRCPLLC